MTISASTRHARRHANSLAWSLRLRHPFAPLILLLGVATVLLAAKPVFTPVLHRYFPADAIQRYQRLMARKASVFEAPGVGPSVNLPNAPMPTATPTGGLALAPGPAQDFFAPSPRGREEGTVASTPPVSLPCHVIHSGAVAGGEGEWAVEIVLDENAVDQAGNVVLPTGLNIAGRVRLGRNSEPTEWPSVWRLHLPEGDGTIRELEVTAAYQSNMGGIAVGATGRFSLRRINRIGDRRGDGNPVAATADSTLPAVSILTNRQGQPSDDLPQR